MYICVCMCVFIIEMLTFMLIYSEEVFYLSKLKNEKTNLDCNKN